MHAQPHNVKKLFMHMHASLRKLVCTCMQQKRNAQHTCIHSQTVAHNSADTHLWITLNVDSLHFGMRLEGGLGCVPSLSYVDFLQKASQVSAVTQIYKMVVIDECSMRNSFMDGVPINKEEEDQAYMIIIKKNLMHDTVYDNAA